MTLRTRLILAFFLLSVVPLTAVTWVSYSSNAAALRDAAEREADSLAGDLAQRMQMVTAQLSERVEHLMSLSELEARVNAAEAVVTTSPSTAAAVLAEVSGVDEQVATALGDAAMLLNNVELRGLRGRGRRGGGRPPLGDTEGRRGDGPPPDPGAARPPRPPDAPAESEVATDVAGERMLIDLAPMRRRLLEQLLQEEQPGGVTTSDLTPEQSARVFRELNARMMGIAEGIQLGAAELQRRAEEVRQKAEEAGASAPAAPVAPAPPSSGTRTTTSVRGTQLGVTMERDGQVVGELNAELNLPNMMATVFQTTRRDQGEVPFAVGQDGRIYARGPADRTLVESLGAVATPDGPATARVNDWIVVTTSNPVGAGLRLGIARPVGDSLANLRRASALTLAMGLGFIALALIGIVPISGRLTRNLTVLSDGVDRIAKGDYAARVPVRSRDEIGQLALAFNRMAADVEQHQRMAVEQERIKRELELGRRIQHEMLPHAPFRSGLTEIRGVSVPAREVGGDFFNYFELPDARIALLVGDVSGKGVGAALLMANIQASLRTRLGLGQGLADVADAIDRDIAERSPGPEYATLFVGTLDLRTRELAYVNAGHNPQYVVRQAGGLERMPSTGLPVGMLAGRGYEERRVQLASGDLLFFYTDGCVEAENEQDEMFGAEQLEALLTSRPTEADDLLAHVEQAVKAFRGSRDASDDATTMTVRVG